MTLVALKSLMQLLRSTCNLAVQLLGKHHALFFSERLRGAVNRRAGRGQQWQAEQKRQVSQFASKFSYAPFPQHSILDEPDIIK